jgi:hypothetical protein
MKAKKRLVHPRRSEPLLYARNQVTFRQSPAPSATYHRLGCSQWSSPSKAITLRSDQESQGTDRPPGPALGVPGAECCALGSNPTALIGVRAVLVHDLISTCCRVYPLIPSAVRFSAKPLQFPLAQHQQSAIMPINSCSATATNFRGRRSFPFSKPHKAAPQISQEVCPIDNVLGTPAWGLGVFSRRPASTISKVGKWSLLLPQGLHWIYGCRQTRRHIAGDTCSQKQHERNCRIGQRIECADPVEQ